MDQVLEENEIISGSDTRWEGTKQGDLREDVCGKALCEVMFLFGR